MAFGFLSKTDRAILARTSVSDRRARGSIPRGRILFSPFCIRRDELGRAHHSSKLYVTGERRLAICRANLRNATQIQIWF
jgi:hypothetical protein